LLQILTEMAYEAIINTPDIHMHTGPRLIGKGVSEYSQLTEDKIVLLKTEYFYRNLDYNDRFGTHTFAKEW
jgi:hypothetical protein